MMKKIAGISGCEVTPILFSFKYAELRACRICYKTCLKNEVASGQSLQQLVARAKLFGASATKLRDISELDPQGIDVIFFDIDDTFTSKGKITDAAYAALWKLKNAGKIVVPITGRPAGWCDMIARTWPVTAVIGENGAFYFMMSEGKLVKNFIWGTKTLKESRQKLEIIRREVLQRYPHAGIASDQEYRLFDLAIDFCEDVAPLSNEEILGIVEIFKRHGANVKVSSIHVNGWFGDYDKLSAAKVFAERELGMDLRVRNRGAAFAGDSPNDESMFEFFANSVGVNNVLEFQNQMLHLPAFITPSPNGAGFVELAEHLLAR